MRRERAEGLVGEVISDIDWLIRQELLPGQVMSMADISDIAHIPVLTQLNEHDRDHVVRRVDEILRVRAGGVD